MKHFQRNMKLLKINQLQQKESFRLLLVNKKQMIYIVQQQILIVTVSFGSESDQMKQEIKYLKEQKLLSDAHWESILADKQQELKKQTRLSQQKQYELCQKIQELQQQIETLEQELSERNSQIETKKRYFRVELQVRDEDLTGFEKVVQSFKKQNNEYKQEQFLYKILLRRKDRSIFKPSINSKIMPKFSKKIKVKKKMSSINAKKFQRNVILKTRTWSQQLSLKTNLKKFKVNTDLNLKKATSKNEQEKGNLQMMVAELKCELERQFEERGSLFA